MVVLDSSRSFQVWEYTVSHGQLLLRSTKSDDEATQVDVLFKNVDVMKLARWFDELRIREATTDERSELRKEVRPEGRDQKCWILESRSFRGYVVAGVVVTHEGEGEYNDPSPLMPYSGWKRTCRASRTRRRLRECSCIGVTMDKVARPCASASPRRSSRRSTGSR